MLAPSGHEELLLHLQYNPKTHQTSDTEAQWAKQTEILSQIALNMFDHYFMYRVIWEWLVGIVPEWHFVTIISELLGWKEGIFKQTVSIFTLWDDWWYRPARINWTVPMHMLWSPIKSVRFSPEGYYQLLPPTSVCKFHCDIPPYSSCKTQTTQQQNSYKSYYCKKKKEYKTNVFCKAGATEL